ncbi:Multiple epidermal growth factor-like domains protein 6 [Manis javanica]|nr:Multiple epidermal growth factor-like domains protein 6 [Manis javanica]
MGRTVSRCVSVRLRMRSVTQSQGDAPVRLAAMETNVISISDRILCNKYPKSLHSAGLSLFIFKYHHERPHTHGYEGCPRGTYGPYCQRACRCMNGSHCDTTNSTCDCPPGFIGADCSQSCPEDH